MLDGERVGSEGEVGKDEIALGVSGFGAVVSRESVVNVDGCAGDDGAGNVSDRSGDEAGGSGLCAGVMGRKKISR